MGNGVGRVVDRRLRLQPPAGSPVPKMAFGRRQAYETVETGRRPRVRPSPRWLSGDAEPTELSKLGEAARVEKGLEMLALMVDTRDRRRLAFFQSPESPMPPKTVLALAARPMVALVGGSARAAMLATALLLATTGTAFADVPRPPLALEFADLAAWRSGGTSFPDVQVRATETSVRRVRVVRSIQSSDGAVDQIAPEVNGVRGQVKVAVTVRFPIANVLPDSAYTDVVWVTIEQDDRDASQTFRFFRHFLVSQGKAVPLTHDEYNDITTRWVEGFDRNGNRVRDVAGVVVRDEPPVPASPAPTSEDVVEPDEDGPPAQRRSSNPTDVTRED